MLFKGQLTGRDQIRFRRRVRREVFPGNDHLMAAAEEGVGDRELVGHRHLLDLLFRLAFLPELIMHDIGDVFQSARDREIFLTPLLTGGAQPVRIVLPPVVESDDLEHVADAAEFRRRVKILVRCKRVDFLPQAVAEDETRLFRGCLKIAGRTETAIILGRMDGKRS